MGSCTFKAKGIFLRTDNFHMSYFIQFTVCILYYIRIMVSSPNSMRQIFKMKCIVTSVLRWFNSKRRPMMQIYTYFFLINSFSPSIYSRQRSIVKLKRTYSSRIMLLKTKPKHVYHLVYQIEELMMFLGQLQISQIQSHSQTSKITTQFTRLFCARDFQKKNRLHTSLPQRYCPSYYNFRVKRCRSINHFQGAELFWIWDVFGQLWIVSHRFGIEILNLCFLKSVTQMSLTSFCLSCYFLSDKMPCRQSSDLNTARIIYTKHPAKFKAVCNFESHLSLENLFLEKANIQICWVGQFIQSLVKFFYNLSSKCPK